MKTHRLSDNKVGFAGKVLRLEGEGFLVERLAEIGVLPGHDIRIKGKVAFGDPLIVEVNGSSFALRKAEADCIACQG